MGERNNVFISRGKIQEKRHFGDSDLDGNKLIYLRI
jgi:hypothetical protein